MFAYYHEVRAALCSPRTNMPQPEALRQEIFVSNPKKARSVLECKKAFVGDVEIYLRRIEWWERIAIEGRMVAPGEDQVSWNKLAKRIGKEGRPLPRALKNMGNLFREYRDIIRPNAEAYFRDRGYLR
jgi:hypothetical protein